MNSTIKVNTINNGDVLETVRKIDDESVDSVITSPPYWQLRDYGYPEQWGLEPTFEQYLEHLWELMDEIWRVLKPSGTVWVNLGDTYNTSQAGNKEYNTGIMSNIDNEDRVSAMKDFKRTKAPLPNKCLLMLPHRFAIGCVDRGWIMRNDIIWAKPNGMPESIRDRFSKKHEFFFFMVKSGKYFFDLDAIRDRHKSIQDLQRRKVKEWKTDKAKDTYAMSGKGRSRNEMYNSNGKNPGNVSDFWEVPVKPSSQNHFASYNFQLIEKPIVAGCPEFVCKKCGKPREKIIDIKSNRPKLDCDNMNEQGVTRTTVGARQLSKYGIAKKEVVGMTDCGCNAGFEGGVVLDPFCGTGTTLVRALQLNRKVIGIDGSVDYCEIASRNINKELNQFKLF